MEYLLPLKDLFEKHADANHAAGAKAYMKNISEFYGLGAPLRRKLLQDFIKRSGLPASGQLEPLIHFAWDQSQREWQYIAMEIAERMARKKVDNILTLSEFMITHKSWWDTVDFISPNIVGTILKRDPAIIRSQIEAWLESQNLWLLRTCLLFQLKYKYDTDTVLLFELCERMSGHKNFFIRKAIGWSLREYSKKNPEAVLQFVNTHQLSSLSHREAIKRIIR